MTENNSPLRLSKIIYVNSSSFPCGGALMLCDFETQSSKKIVLIGSVDRKEIEEPFLEIYF